MDTPASPEPTPPGGDQHRMPRWVRGFVVVAVAAALVIVVALMIGSDGHGPARHLPGSVEGTTQTPDGHTPPVDHG